MKNSIIILILAALVFMTYGNALFNDFTWDDFGLIVDNPFIKSIDQLPSLFTQHLGQHSPLTFGKGFQAYYRPFFVGSFMIDYCLWRLNPFFYHLENIVLYFFNILLVFFFVKNLTKNITLSFLTSLFFCLHPVHTEAVTPIFDRMDVLVTCFILGSLLFFIKAINQKKGRNRFYFFSLACLVFGLLSKE
ncbi:hypothetical protein ACFL38_00470, partial [Candidatus Omnitrophota bacterium]